MEVGGVGCRSGYSSIEIRSHRYTLTQCLILLQSQSRKGSSKAPSRGWGLIGSDSVFWTRDLEPALGVTLATPGLLRRLDAVWVAKLEKAEAVLVVIVKTVFVEAFSLCAMARAWSVELVILAGPRDSPESIVLLRSDGRVNMVVNV